MLTRCCPSLTLFSTSEVYMYRPRLSNHLAIVSGSQEDRMDPEEEVEDDKLSQEEPLTLSWQCGKLTEFALLSLFIIFLRSYCIDFCSCHQNLHCFVCFSFIKGVNLLAAWHSVITEGPFWITLF